MQALHECFSTEALELVQLSCWQAAELLDLARAVVPSAAMSSYKRNQKVSQLECNDVTQAPTNSVN